MTLCAITPCATDKISDIWFLGQVILMVDCLFQGQESILKSCHWKIGVVIFDLLWMQCLDQAWKVEILRFVDHSFLLNNVLSIVRGCLTQAWIPRVVEIAVKSQTLRQ